jgi:hypothetical protein
MSKGMGSLTGPSALMCSCIPWTPTNSDGGFAHRSDYFWTDRSDVQNKKSPQPVAKRRMKENPKNSNFLVFIFQDSGSKLARGTDRRHNDGQKRSPLDLPMLLKSNINPHH